jgi:hypothetical protein
MAVAAPMFATETGIGTSQVAGCLSGRYAAAGG